MTAVHPGAGPAAPAAPGLPADPRKHPKGLYLLFSTEMWERMSYYGMRALLTLYMVDKTRGGLGLDDKTALQIYGIYTALVFLTPLAGGYLADRYLGQRRAVVIGGTMMMIGQFLLAMSGLPAFYAGLSMLILGNGMFKPNIATMVGGLYPKAMPVETAPSRFSTWASTAERSSPL
jgi:POT family proton-dependent oligopeptide transporter